MPTATPRGGFDDDLQALDPARWLRSDGWANAAPFWCGWRADHATLAGGRLTLKLDDTPAGQQPYAGAELRSVAFYGYGRVEARFKAAAAPGVVSSLFTYAGPSDGKPHDEVDIEILGHDPTRLQANYYANGVGGHETLIDLGFDASREAHAYAFAWTPTAIRWYVDGQLVHTEAGARGPLPSTPGRIMANLWAARGVDDWAGKFVYGGTPVTATYERFGYTPL